MRILEIAVLDEERKIVSMGFEYPDYELARKDFDVLCEVFGRMIDYRRIIQSLEPKVNK